MLRNEYDRFFEAMKDLGEIFGARVSDRRAELYLALLRDYPFDVVDRAMTKAMETEDYFPKPAKLRALILADEQYRQEWNQRELQCKPFEGRDEWPPAGHPKERISLRQWQQETGEKLDFSKAIKRMPKVKVEP